MRRRRRNRSTWFPVLGFEAGETLTPTTWDSRLVVLDAAGLTNVFALPLIPDDTRDPADATFSGDYTLRDYVEGQTCIIDRIVGKIQWAMAQEAQADPNVAWVEAICCSAIAVLPVADDNSSPGISSDDWNPLAATNADKPWLWRRTWLLGDNSSTGDAPQYTWPVNNCQFPGVLDGPHIDTKGTKRAIRKNQRLFLIHAAQGVVSADGSFPATLDGQMTVTADVRVLGRMVRGRNRGNFSA